MNMEEREKHNNEMLKILRKTWKAGELNDNQKSFFNDNSVEPQRIKVLTNIETTELKHRWVGVYLDNFPEVLPNNFMLHRCSECDNYIKNEQIGYNWHAFSYKLFPHKKVGRDFLKSYNTKERNLIIMWEYCKFLAVELPTDIVKKLNFPDNEDIYVFPRDCSWTFINTHEDIYTHEFECFFAKKQ